MKVEFTVREGPPEVLVETAMKEAVAAALAFHKRIGNPVCILQDGEIKWLQPEEIPDSTGPAK